MTTTAARFVVHCRPCEWLSSDRTTAQAATDLAGTHDDTLHPGHGDTPIATVIPLIGARLPLPIPHIGQPLALAA
jgi:hypothetical protein